MIKLKESQLIAMLNIVKENPDVDTWELMSASGVRVLKEKSINFSDSIKSCNVDEKFNQTRTRKIPSKGHRYHPEQEEFYK